MAVEEEKNAVLARSLLPEANKWYREQDSHLPDVPTAETYHSHILPKEVPSPFVGNETKYAELRSGVERTLLFRMMTELVERLGKQKSLSIDYTLKE